MTFSDYMDYLRGKRIGVIGLGNVGSKVANACVDLGMDVYGYDPFLSVDTALRLDRHVHVVKDINDLYKRADYVTMHIHYTEKTAHMINADAGTGLRAHQLRARNHH